MRINIDKFNKWLKETSLNIEINALNCSADEITEGLLTIKGNMDDITKCLVILTNHWDNSKKKNHWDKNKKKKNKKKKVQHTKGDK